MICNDIKLLIVDLLIPFKKFVWDAGLEGLSVHKILLLKNYKWMISTRETHLNTQIKVFIMNGLKIACKLRTLPNLVKHFVTKKDCLIYILNQIELDDAYL